MSTFNKKYYVDWRIDVSVNPKKEQIERQYKNYDSLKKSERKNTQTQKERHKMYDRPSANLQNARSPKDHKNFFNTTLQPST